MRLIVLTVLFKTTAQLWWHTWLAAVARGCALVAG